MSLAETLIPLYQANRQRTLSLLDTVAQLPNAGEAFGFRPGPGRAHIAWQLMHLAVTEELFATERLAPHKQGAWQELWPRFRGGSMPDDNIPTATELREVLAGSRQHLLETLTDYPDSRLEEIPPSLAQRNLKVRDVLHILSWHEAHHQGQAHLTLNLFRHRTQA